MVLVPLLALAAWRATFRARFGRAASRSDWIDGILTTGRMLVPLALAFQQIQILQQRFPPPTATDLFIHRPASDWSGAILAVPLGVWLVPAPARAIVSQKPGLGNRAAGTRDLDGDPGLCSGRGLAGQPGLVA